MAFYIHVTSTGTGGVWDINDREAVRLGVTNPQEGPGSYFAATADQSIWEVIRARTPWFEPPGPTPFHELDLAPGEYYPRIARPSEHHPSDFPGGSPWARQNRDKVAMAQAQLEILTQRLAAICRTVHPEGNNLEAYGHEVRDLLILASTEVESQWKGVLNANNYIAPRRHLTALDYSSLAVPMRLAEYAVGFPTYPWLTPVRPFADWGGGLGGFAKLGWYEAYNAVKHNREDEFSRGSLNMVFQAVAAVAVMLVGQFGIEGWKRPQREFFAISEVPEWSLKELYCSPFGRESTPVDCTLVPLPLPRH